MGKLKEILDGWGNVVKETIGLLDPKVKEEAERRLKICDRCPIRSTSTCDPNLRGHVIQDFTYSGEKRKKGQLVNGCGCNISAKTLSPDSQCPMGLWEPINLTDNGQEGNT